MVRYHKRASMSKRAGYAHYWKYLDDSGFSRDQWAKILREAKQIINKASRDGVILAGPVGTGSPVLDNNVIALNGNRKLKEDYESFILDRVPQEGFNFCKTNNKPYDAVVVSILSAAQKIAPDVIEVSSDGGSSAIKRVYASDSIDSILAELEEREARFEKGVPVDVPQYLRDKGNPEAAEEWEDMNEKYRDKFKTSARGPSLLPNSIKNKIPKLYSQENEPDPIVYVKFFSPYNNWTWLVTEFDGRDTFFGLAGGPYPELGYFSLSELQNAKKGPLPLVERDAYFKPGPLSKVRARERMASKKN